MRDISRIGVLRSAVLIIQFTGVMIVLHLLQILLWAAFYRWNCFLSWEFAFYFSTASYTTVGADVVLPRMWQTLGPVESLTGVLMCGLSASFLFAIVGRLIQRYYTSPEELANPVAERVSTLPQIQARASEPNKERRR